MKTYPESMMHDLRERLDLEPNDKSEDERIMLRSPNRNFKEIMEWHGIIGWDYRIKSWVKEIYGVDLDEVSYQIEQENRKS